jgi:uncharacterized membrane protein
MTSQTTSRRSFVLLAASAAFTGLLSGCGGGGGSATQQSAPIPLPLSEDPLFQITDLGLYDQFLPVDLNNRGEILAYGPHPRQGALLRSPNGTVQTLGIPPGIAGSVQQVHKIALNDNGASLVTIVIRDVNDVSHAFFWQNGVAQDIGTLGGAGAAGTDINNQNQIIGYSDILYQGGPGPLSRAFLWQEGRMTVLTMPTDVAFNPLLINDNGTILVYTETRKGSYSYSDAVLANGSLTYLRAPDGAEGSFAARDINNRGQLVGFGGAGGGGISGYLLENGVATNLSVIGGEAEFNDPRAINGFGTVVGGTRPLPLGEGGSAVEIPWKTYGHAFMYQGGRTYDLQTTIPADSGWVLREALDINDRGQIIGRGFFNGEHHSFLLNRQPR